MVYFDNLETRGRTASSRGGGGLGPGALQHRLLSIENRVFYTFHKNLIFRKSPQVRTNANGVVYFDNLETKGRTVSSRGGGGLGPGELQHRLVRYRKLSFLYFSKKSDIAKKSPSTNKCQWGGILRQSRNQRSIALESNGLSVGHAKLSLALEFVRHSMLYVVIIRFVCRT